MTAPKAEPMGGYRVFISYAGSEVAKRDFVGKTLSRLGLSPWLGMSPFHDGTGFDAEIQNRIAHSHLFVPILTPAAHRRGWVHQEIGFALANHIPIVPICNGKLPDGMIKMANAIVVKKIEHCAAHLRKENFPRLIARAGQNWLPSGTCIHEPGARAAQIARLATEAGSTLADRDTSEFRSLIVRHAGGLSSFRIPDAPPGAVWESHYGRAPRGNEIYEKLRTERLALGRHAESAGCRLIVNWGIDLDKAYGRGVWRSRLSTLLDFLRSPSGRKAEVVLVDDLAPQSLLMVGNWFLAESAAVRPARGIQHTLFQVHAPSIDRRAAEFDRDFLHLLRMQGVSRARSRTVAIERLQRRVRELPSHPSYPENSHPTRRRATPS